jgi:carbonic anhydrase
MDYLKDLERASVIRALDNLMRFPCIRVLVERQHLQLHAAHFDVATRLLSAFDLKAKTFVSVAGVEHSGLFSRSRF